MNSRIDIDFCFVLTKPKPLQGKATRCPGCEGSESLWRVMRAAREVQALEDSPATWL